MLHSKFSQILCCHWLVLMGLISVLHVSSAYGQAKIAVLDFELRDLTLLPGVPEEVDRTASVKLLLERQLADSGFGVVNIPGDAQLRARAGFGYLFDHHDLAARLGKQYGADYVIVGRVHKPSFLFVYLMAHLVDVNNERLIADYSSEVKGSDKKLTSKGVESLIVKIKRTMAELK